MPLQLSRRNSTGFKGVARRGAGFAVRPDASLEAVPLGSDVYATAAAAAAQYVTRSNLRSAVSLRRVICGVSSQVRAASS